MDSGLNFPRLIVVFYLCLLQFGSIANARTLTWNDCLNLLSEKNPELQTAIESVKQSKYQETVSQSGYYPKLSASAGRTQSYLSTSTPNVSTSNSISLNASANLFAGLSDFSRSKQAQAGTRTSRAQLRIAQAKVSSDLKQALANLIYAQESLALTQKILDRRQENLRSVDFRFRGGRENKGSVLLSEAYFEQARFDRLAAEESLRVAQAQLRQVLGLEGSESITWNDQLPLSEPAKKPDFEKLAIEMPEVGAARAQEESANWGIDAARSGFYPSLDLTGSVGKSDSVVPMNEDRWSFGISITLPLFDGGKDLASTRAASSKWSSAMSNRRNVELQTLAKLEQAFSDFLLSFEKLKVDEKFRSAASTRADIARSKYNNGLMSFDDWDQVENDLITRERNVITSRKERIISEAAWEKASGQASVQGVLE